MLVLYFKIGGVAMELVRPSVRARRGTTAVLHLRQASMGGAEAGGARCQLQHQALCPLLCERYGLLASSSGQPRWRGVEVWMLLCLCCTEEALAAFSSTTRGGQGCRRDLWPEGWPFFYLHCGGLLDLAPELAVSRQPSGSSPAATGLPASNRSPAGRDRLLHRAPISAFVRLEVAGVLRRRGPRT